MRKAIAVATGVLIMAAFTVGAQEKAKTDESKAKRSEEHTSELQSQR